MALGVVGVEGEVGIVGEVDEVGGRVSRSLTRWTTKTRQDWLRLAHGTE